MIQDIFPHVLKNEYENKRPGEDSRIVIFRKGEILMKGLSPSTCDFPYWKDACREGLGEDCIVYIFSLDGTDFFIYLGQNAPVRAGGGKGDEGAKPLTAAEAAEALGRGYTFFNIRTLSASSHRYTMFAAITAHHIYSWYRANRFCGRCGCLMRHDEKERMLRCDCGNMVYPRISPAIIAAVTNKDKILLTKYADRDYKKYALIAGFAEVGESIEECLRREIREEVGLEVTNIRYYKSQPWAFSQSLLMGFFCDVDGSDKVEVDHEELAVAEWISREDLEVELDGVSLTNEMMLMFREGEPV